MTPLEITLDVISKALSGEDPEEVLADAFRQAPELRNWERGQVSRNALGVACHRSRLRAFVEAARLEPSARNLMLAYGIRELRITAEAAVASLGVELKDATALANCEPSWPEDSIGRLAMQHSLPGWLAKLWSEEWGEVQAHQLAAASNRPGPKTLRANALRGAREEIAKRLEAEGISTFPGKHAPMALHVDGQANLFGSAAWQTGDFEVQDEGSQMVIEACAARPGERWLDLCAGSGGKTLGLAASMGNQGELWATVVDRKVAPNLHQRLKRSGAVAKSLHMDDGLESNVLRGELFDGILVDAPCSELGTLRRHVGARWRMNPESFEALPRLQGRLIDLAREHLRPGGRLVYATCTLRRAENEAVVGQGYRMRTWTPHREGTDGFFIAQS